MKEKQKSCWNCQQLRFGGFLDTFDACDYMCEYEIKNENGKIVGDRRSRLFCTHGLTPKQVTQKLRKMGTQCERWKEK